MGNKQLTEEMNSYSITELEAICATQGDMYTDEEMRMIVQILERKRQEQHVSNQKDLRATLYCIVGLLLPVVGLIIAICQLASGDMVKRSIGKKVLIAVGISFLLGLFLLAGGLSL